MFYFVFVHWRFSTSIPMSWGFNSGGDGGKKKKKKKKKEKDQGCCVEAIVIKNRLTSARPSSTSYPLLPNRPLIVWGSPGASELLPNQQNITVACFYRDGDSDDGAFHSYCCCCWWPRYIQQQQQQRAAQLGYLKFHHEGRGETRTTVFNSPGTSPGDDHHYYYIYYIPTKNGLWGL